jgi:hypothetical protein
MFAEANLKRSITALHVGPRRSDDPAGRGLRARPTGAPARCALQRHRACELVRDDPREQRMHASIPPRAKGHELTASGRWTAIGSWSRIFEPEREF